MGLAPRINRLFPAISAAAFPVAFGIACGSQTPEPRFPTPNGHDLMYSRNKFGIPLELDSGHDDYFDHNIPGCLDTADSPYLEPRN